MARAALLVGINEYSQAPLRYCVRDAEETALALELDNYGFETSVVRNDAASRNELYTQLEHFLTRRPDLFVFYFAGHGCRTNLGSYLVTHDWTKFEEGIELQHLARWMQRFTEQGSRTICLLDCCHSGSAFLPTPNVKPLVQRDIEQAARAFGPAQVILAACRPEELAFEDPDTAHGAFTAALLDGLLGAAADPRGAITVNSLYDYICAVSRAHARQTPVFRGDITGPFLFAEGFQPISSPNLDELELSKTGQIAYRLIDQFDQRQTFGFDDWPNCGHLEACQVLEPILAWFDKTLTRHPSLGKRATFSQYNDAAKARLKRLADIDLGTRTKFDYLVERLGDGAFGTVWKTEDSDGRHYAYKVYHPRDLTLEKKIN